MDQRFDLIIVGGGLVGASLAVAFANSPLRIAVIEPHAFDTSQQPSFDERTVALTYSARQIYTGMGIWKTIAAKGIEPIKDIHISNRGHFGITHLSHLDIGTAALGYVVPTRTMGEVLHGQISAAPNITLLEGATAETIKSEDDWSAVTIDYEGKKQTIQAKLTVIADGGRSPLTTALQTVDQAYAEQALLSIVNVDRPHHGRAYERFTNEGPLALLPHQDRRYAVVWTSSADALNHRLALSDADFIAALQDTFGDRAGTFSNPSQRKSYPLTRSKLETPGKDRMVVIGNAAHTVHPVAGQGFNLGLRDVAYLAELIVESTAAQQDIGSDQLIKQYISTRQRDTSMVQKFTHSLIAIFSNELKAVGLLRNIGLFAIENCPPAKRFLLKRTMGMRSQPSILARGGKLYADPVNHGS